MTINSPGLRRILPLLTIILAVAAAALPALAADDSLRAEPGGQDRSPAEPVVEILQVRGPLDPPVVAAVRELVEQAEARGSEAVVLQLDSPGAVDLDVHEVVEPIRAARVPVVTWLGPGSADAAGAALFLAMASHLPAATTTANLGPACPPAVADACRPGDLNLLEALLRERGWTDEEVSRAVDRLASSQIVAGEAVDGTDGAFVNLIVDGLEGLLIDIDGRSVTTVAGPKTLEVKPEEVTIRFHSLGLVRRTLHAVLDPAVVYLLLIGILLLVAFEVFQPGFGVAGAAAVLLSPLAVYGLVVLPLRWWALGLIVVGVLALALDLAIAGLGVPTVLGALALATGSWQLFEGDSPLLRLSPWLVGAAVGFAVVHFVVIMTVVLRAQSGPDPRAVPEDLVGRPGTVRSALNPEGYVFVAGALWRARWVGAERGRVRAGTQVRVAGVDENVLLVKDCPASGLGQAKTALPPELESEALKQTVARDAAPPGEAERTS